MPVLTCTLRNDSIKIKALRRSGNAPGIIYGKNLQDPIKIQFTDNTIAQLIRETSIGSQVTVSVDGVTYVTMLKKVDYVPMSNAIQHVDFQVLTTGEKIKTSAPIHFINRDLVSIEGNVQERMSAIEYEVLPVDIAEFFVVDLSKLVLGQDIKLQDLDIVNDEKYNFITPLNASLVSLVISKVYATTEEPKA